MIKLKFDNDKKIYSLMRTSSKTIPVATWNSGWAWHSPKPQIITEWYFDLNVQKWYEWMEEREK